MKIVLGDISATDLRGDTLADLLVNIESDIQLIDAGRVLYEERLFPVAELARELARWRTTSPSRQDPPNDFSFNSLSFDEPGAVTIRKIPAGWVVGTVLSPGTTSRPEPWSELSVELDEFIDQVGKGIRELGLNLDRILHSDR
jgi:hypothetical protein